MGETSAIEWTDATWNPVIGCAKVSPGCKHCYAEAYARNRLQRPELWRGERHVTAESTWKLPEQLDRKAEREGRRLRLFVASLADVFEDHPAWEARYRGYVLSVRQMALQKLDLLRNVDVLLLTKRPENVRRMVPENWLRGWPRHVWLGTTVEDQERAQERIPHLLSSPACVRFLSCEPLLGPIDFDAICGDAPNSGFAVHDGLGRFDGEGPAGIHWVIAGGEAAGPEARPMHPAWARSLRDQCAAAGVPFLFKQHGDWAHAKGSYRNERGQLHFWQRPSRSWDLHEFPDGEAVMRYGKAATGRLLDGREHNDFPGRPA